MTTKILNTESAVITISPLIFDKNKRVVFINQKGNYPSTEGV